MTDFNKMNKSSMMTNGVGWIFSGVVLLLLFAVGAILKNPVRLLITGERTEGIVVGMETRPGSPGQASWQLPIVEFVTSTGERVRVSGRSPSASARVGDTFTVAYDPPHPKDAQILSLGEFGLGHAGVVLGFTAFIILIWISRILAGDSTFDDPLHLLPAVISHFRLLRAKGADVNAKNAKGETPLHLAAKSGEQEVARLLLAKGADVNAKDAHGEAPLHLAAESGKQDIVELLLAKGADVNAKDAYGETPLHLAVSSANKDIAELLLARSADVNAKDEDGRTPLHIAEELGNPGVAELLLAKGADANAKDKDGKTPAELSGVSGK